MRAASDSLGSARRWYAREALAVAARVSIARSIRPRRTPTRSAESGTSSFTHASRLSTARAHSGGGPWGSAFASDLGQALRSLRHAPSFVLLTTLTLALGVGATTAIFSVVDGILLRPLPYDDPEELVVSKVALGDEELENHSEPEVLDLMAETDVFSAVAAYRGSEPLLGVGDEPQRVRCLLATASLLDVLGVRPMLGRFYTAEEDRAEASERVAVLSHGLWVRAFGADPSVVGRTVSFENLPHTIVGVMPPDFSFPSPGVEVLRPLRIDRRDPVARNNHYLGVVARLADGVTSTDAARRLDALGARSSLAYPEFYSEPMTYRTVPMREDMVGDVRAPLLLLMAAVALVLLIAAVNAASLFLARGQGRRAEIAVRTALGAARGRVAGQLLGESVFVATLSGALGVALAYGGVAVLRRVAPPDLPRLDQITVDTRVLLFGLAVAIATGLVFGLAPAGQAWRSDVREVLAAGGRGGMSSRRGGRFRRALVVSQLALAMVLALGAGLMVRSFAELRGTELGFSPRGVLVVPLAPHASTVAPDGDAVAFYRRLEERVEMLPGVVAVGSALRIPLASGHDNYSIQVEGREVATIGESPSPGMEWPTPGYFEAMGIPLLRGRLFTTADHADAPLVAVIGEGTARELWPGEDAIGKRLRLFNETSPWMEVVGIVADVRHYGVRAEPSAKLYVPHLQGFLSGYYSPNTMNLFVRTDGDPVALSTAVRQTVRELEPGIPIGAVRTMDQVVGAALAPDRFTLMLLAGFATGALLLAAVGVYGVVAEAVEARTREIGLRMAIGAARTRILRQVLLEGLLLAGWGVVLGSLGGSLMARLLDTVLYRVSPSDAAAYLSAAPSLVAVVLIASLIPALRAARLDPMRALREG